MKIHLYTDVHSLFGDVAMAWLQVLDGAGHDVEYIDLGIDPALPLPAVGPCDVNLVVGGLLAADRFTRHGMPAHGKTVWCLYDPLTHDDASPHRSKAAQFEPLIPRLHAVAAMDGHIAGFLKRHHPGVKVLRIPYVLADARIAAPLPDAGKTIDVLFMGQPSARRREVEQHFRKAGVALQFIEGRVWGKARDTMRRASRIILSIQIDATNAYLDQFRAVDGWAAGAVVVAEPSGDLHEHGIVNGVHLMTATPEGMSALCRDLLADAPRREALIRAGQALARERFAVSRWRGEMLAAVESAAN